MTAQRFIGFSALLCVAASCASLNHPAKPKGPADAGPKAWIYTSYSGGILNRRVDPVFKVDRDAYVMLAHLGGDGRIEVLYPRDARESGRVPGGKYFRTQSFSAYYDAAPQLYSFAMTHYRNLGARSDSYDGSGNGFVFLIASRYPLLFDRVSSFGLWDDVEVDSYRWTADPRGAIGNFVNTVTGGAAYTLKYASSFASQNQSSYADYLFDCAFFSFSNFGYYGSTLSGFGGFPSNAWGFFASAGRGYFSGCPQYGYASQYTFGNGYVQGRPYVPPPTANPATPTGGTLALTRPPGRRTGEAGPAFGFNNRPTFNRPPTATQTVDYAPADRPGRGMGWGGRSGGTGFGDPRWGGTTPSTNNGTRYTPSNDAPRSTPSYDTPRSFSPAPSSPAPQVSAPAPPAAQPSSSGAAPRPSSGEERKP